jgi:peptidoglycan/LPS O-acetylase OafA/YrhL
MANSDGASENIQRAYRPEIDGLRTVAVVAVILNHFDRAVLPLGYLGVDIFFVISGFVITSSIYHRVGGGLFQFWSAFYGRRFKRLFPALAACVLITSILICLVDPAPVASLRTGASSLFGLSNFYLLKQATDYFGTWADLNAFTHTWSLGVEEQFYLVFPFVVWATGFRRAPTRTSTAFITVVGVASVISLAFDMIIAAKSQPLSFFLPLSRIWELGIGVLLFSITAPGTLISRRAQIIPSGLVLTCLVALLLLPVDAEIPATIIAVALSAVLIAGIRPGAPTYRLMTLPAMSYLGKMSYSLYLWHWSVICLSRWTVGLSWWLAPVQLGLVFVLAAASYHALEVPLRRAQWSRSQVRSVLYGLASVSGVAMAIVFLLGPGHGYLFLGATRTAAAAAPSHPHVSPSKGVLFLIGDSHAGEFVRLAKDVSATFGLRPSVISENATPFPAIPISSPVGGLTLEKTRSTAANMERNVQQALAGLDDRESNIIILSSFYRLYFEPLLGERKYQIMTHYDATGRPISAEQSLDNWLGNLKAFAAHHRKTRIIIFLSTPEMPGIYWEALCRKEWFRPHPSDKCYIKVDRQKTVAMLGKLNSRIIQAVASAPNVSVFDPMPALCPEGQAACRSQDGDDRLFADEDHLTVVGVSRVETAFSDFLLKSGLVR